MKKISTIVLVSLVGILFSQTSLQAPHALAAVNYCPPLAAATGKIVTVSTASALANAVTSSASGTTILVADGTYTISSALRFGISNVTLRSQSGNREAVILNGNYGPEEMFYIAAPYITVADMTIERAGSLPIHVVSGGTYSMLYNLRILDGREQFVKINPDGDGYPDFGTLACSYLEMTDAGRTYLQAHPTPGFDCYTGGVDAIEAQGWEIRDSIFKNIYCTNGGLAQHAVNMWDSSRDSVIERNIFINNARDIGLGLGSSVSADYLRTYPDNPLAAAGLATASVQHIGGIIRNNFLFSNSSYHDTAIGIEQTWGASVYHNTVFATGGLGLDVRFANSNPILQNNLLSPGINFRDSGKAKVNSGNVTATSGMFVNQNTGDLHLLSTATAAINKGVSLNGLVPTDIDGDTRDTTPDVGADEISGTPPPSTKTGDLNNDNKVDIFDYNILVGNFGKTGTGIAGDIIVNGAVDIFDYNQLVGNFGK